MKKKGVSRLVLISVAALIIGLAVFLYFYIGEGVILTPEEQKTAKSLELMPEELEKAKAICEVMPDSIKNDCYINLAIKKEEPSFCEKIDIRMVPNYDVLRFIRLKNSCYSAIATKKRDTKICDLIVDYKKQIEECIALSSNKLSQCESLNLQEHKEICQAINKNEISLCEKLIDPGYPYYSTLCYATISKQRKDPSICERIGDEEVQFGCYIELAKELEMPSLCEKLPETYMETPDIMISPRGWCYHEVGSRLMVTNDLLPLCEKLGNPEWCITSAAVNKLDESICKVLCDNPEEGSCYECKIKVAVAKNDSGICDRIECPEIGSQLALCSYKDRCYKEIAIKTKNSSLCENVKHHKQANKEHCITIAKGDASLCKETNDISICLGLASELKNPSLCKTENMSSWYCYHDFAMELRDPELCANIDKDVRRDDCYKELAQLLLDVNICEDINDLYQKHTCYQALAAFTRDTSICEKITETERDPLRVSAERMKNYCYENVFKEKR